VWETQPKKRTRPKDLFPDEKSVAASFINLAYKMGVKNLPKGMNAKSFTRRQLDRLHIGISLKSVRWGNKVILLPPTQLNEKPTPWITGWSPDALWSVQGLEPKLSFRFVTAIQELAFSPFIGNRF